MHDQAERAARAARRDHCRGCATPTLHPFHGWVTGDGRENSIRPRAYYRSCGRCGLVVMVLADANDAEGLARKVLDEHLRTLGGAATATANPVGPAPVDWDAALNFLFEMTWTLYSEKWDPTVGVTFRSYAIGIMRQRLPRWIQDERGEASSAARQGRVHPKAHASSVSTSYDELAAAALDGGSDDLGGLVSAGRGRAGDFADDRSPDLARALAARSGRPARAD